MKKTTLLLIPLVLGLLLMAGCKKDDKKEDNDNEHGVVSPYKGNYFGTFKHENEITGVFSASVYTGGDMQLSAIQYGSQSQLAGLVSTNGNFILNEIGGEEFAVGEGTIDEDGYISGAFDFGIQCQAKGEPFLGGTPYVGTWYQSDNGVYFQMIITESSYIENQDADEDGIYEIMGIDEGKFSAMGNDLSVQPYSGGEETGKYYATEDTLVIKLIGLSAMVYTKTDYNPNAK